MSDTSVHNASTEILLIISSTVFYVVLFLLLKAGLVDKRGMLSSKERINDELPQIIAVFFSIFVMVAILMIPIDSYEYAHYVVPITFVIMMCVVAYEVYGIYYVPEPGKKNVSFTPDLENDDEEKPSTPGFWSGAFVSTDTKTPKRPI